MELTNKQMQGLKIAVDRFKHQERYTVISGYAGTGKSTLVKFIIEALHLQPDQVAYVAFTGKAAEVLRSKGCPNAMTAHKLLYYSNKTKTGKFTFRPRQTLEKGFKLIVCDEVSMLPIGLWNLLLSHKIPVIACGDPGQIPPIDKNTDNHVLEHPHIFLDEIMRQAKDSEIIRLSMDIREEKPIQFFKGNEVQVIAPKDIVPGMYLWADEILCATNNKRKYINNYIRQMQGKGEFPEIGDKIISLSNHWDILDENGEMPLINGTIGYIESFRRENFQYAIKQIAHLQVPVMITNINAGDNIYYKNIITDYSSITTGEKFLKPEQEYALYKSEFKPLIPCEFNYGYAITVHRAQGSSWGKVMVMEERFPFDREEHKRWLYTAVTRAEDRCILVRS